MTDIDTDMIVSALKREQEDAEDFFTSEIRPEIEAANSYYEARPFGDESEGRSQIVLPDVMEAIDYMTISVLRLFLSGERVVDIEAMQEEDEAGADEATAAVHFNFMREQDGARLLTDWLQSGLLERVGIIKTLCEMDERVTRETFNADPMQIAAYEAGMIPLPEGAEIEDTTDNEDGTVSVTLKTTKTVKRFRDVTIPAEEFRFSRNARHEDASDYIAHICLKPRHELVEMGFDRDQVDELPTDNTLESDTWRDSQMNWRDTTDLPPELQTVTYCHEFMRMDVDGDGIAELVEVHRVGDEILIDAKTGKPAIETVTENPFAVFCPFPRAHRMVGNSLADKTMDLQRIRSVVARQMQDAIYIGNMPRPLVDVSNEYASITLEDILRPIPGSPIRYKGTPPMPFQAGTDVSKSLAVLEYWNGERETRTGITRLNQGLDADTLNKTATGAALMASQGQQMEEAVARNFGEAFGRLLAKKVRLMREEGAQYPIKVEGQYSMADAANWPADFSLSIRVGLGTGRREQRLQYLFALSNVMERGFEVGAVNNEGLFRLGNEIVQAMQLGQGDDYFVNPADQPEQAEQPDPALLEMQAKAQMEQQKLELKAQADQAKLEGDTMLAQARLQMNAEEAAQKADLARQKAEFEANLASEKAQFEANLAVRKMAMEQELARTKAENMPDNRPGGDLSK